jgi:hypothetical protein
LTTIVWGETRTPKLLRPLPATETVPIVLPIPVAVLGVLVAIAMPVTTPAVAVAVAISRMIGMLPIPAGCSMLVGTAVLAALR